MIRNQYKQASHLTQDKTRNISNNNDPVRIERTVHVNILHMSNVGILYGKIYASAKFAIDTKNDLKFIFQCGIGVYHKLNEEKNVMRSAAHRKIINIII